jgi:hypothetical protein
MSKKSYKRKNQKGTGAAVAVQSAPTAATRTVITASPTRAAEFNPDYSYVIKDLRRISVLAGSFFAVLIALSLILPLIFRL